MVDPTSLPTNIDSTYADRAGEPGDKVHQQHHDVIHAAVNALTAATSVQAVQSVTAGTGIVVNNTDPANPVVSLAARAINAQTGTTYTLAAADAGKFLTLTNAAATTLTVPANSTVAFPVGTVVEGAQLGAGQVTITAASGVTVNASPGLKVAARYGTFGLLKTATDVWLAYGRLAA